MFSRIKISLMLLMGLSLANISVAQGNLAVVDVERVIFSTDFAKQTLAQLENSTSYKTRLDEFKAISEEIQKLQNEAQTNGLTWSDEQKRAYQQDLQRKAEQRQLLGQQLDKDQLETRRNIQAQISPKLEGIIKAFVEEKKIGVLLNAQTVVYRSEAVDVTDELIERANAAK